jgi:hypothetical protein
MKLIPLTKGQFAIVDDDDYTELSRFKWYAYKRGNIWYAARRLSKKEGRKTVHMHTSILQSSRRIDHCDGNGLNNRRYNLRFSTHKQNTRNGGLRSNNSSGFMGVHWDSLRRKWHAQIKVDGKSISLGRFDEKWRAALERDYAAIERFVEFARLNLPFLV